MSAQVCNFSSPLSSPRSPLRGDGQRVSVFVLHRLPCSCPHPVVTILGLKSSGCAALAKMLSVFGLNQLYLWDIHAIFSKRFDPLLLNNNVTSISQYWFAACALRVKRSPHRKKEMLLHIPACFLHHWVCTAIFRILFVLTRCKRSVSLPTRFGAHGLSRTK
jgi:hypothetical protein